MLDSARVTSWSGPSHRPAEGTSERIPLARFLVGSFGLLSVFAIENIVAEQVTIRVELARLTCLFIDGIALALLSARFGDMPMRRLMGWCLGVIVVVNLCLTVLVFALDYAIPHVIFVTAAPPLTLRLLLSGVAYPPIVVAAWTLAYLYPLERERLLRQYRETARLRRDVELAHLRSSLEPHFVLNTLTAIAGLVGDDPEEARRLLGAFGDLFRDLLRPYEVHSIRQEIAWLRGYVTLLEARYRGRFEVSWSISERAESTEIPRLLLQPLLENAVMHGALQREGGGGRVSVHVDVAVGPSHQRRSVVCSLTDNGPGFDTARVREGSLGLRLVRERLRACGAGDTLTVASTEDGVRAAVEVPMVSTVAS